MCETVDSGIATRLGKQARSVIDGLNVDTVTLALAYDIGEIAERALLAKDWQRRLTHNSSPYTSTVVFLIRKNNLKNIKNCSELAKPGTSVGFLCWLFLSRQLNCPTDFSTTSTSRSDAVLHFQVVQNQALRCQSLTIRSKELLAGISGAVPDRP
jgi:hypothetical protein